MHRNGPQRYSSQTHDRDSAHDDSGNYEPPEDGGAWDDTEGGLHRNHQGRSRRGAYPERTEIMNASRLIHTSSSVVCLSLALFFISSCSNAPQDRFQGYVEGEFVYVASPLAGQLESLQVRRGDQVKAGEPLFALDETAEKAALDMARAALVLSEAEFTRQETLFRSGPAAEQD